MACVHSRTTDLMSVLTVYLPRWLVPWHRAWSRHRRRVRAATAYPTRPALRTEAAQVGPAGQSGLREQALDVLVHRPHRDEQPTGDLLARHTLNHEREHIGLPAGDTECCQWRRQVRATRAT